MKLEVLLWASVALANPLRLDINIHVDEQKSSCATEETQPLTTNLPVVELLYEKHRASPPQVFNQSFYNFSNIPYAQQPIGNLRFKAAKSIEPIQGELPMNDGQKCVVCPQSQVGWVPHAQDFLKDYHEFNKNLDQKWSYKITPKDNYTWTENIDAVQNMDEACLTLDVMVPKRIYDKRDDWAGYPAPVMVWFFGGGYVFGSKHLFGGPAGLFNASNQLEDIDEQDFIFVAVNYRLGAFGWLAENIAFFGGNPYDITVVGESAGASSILQHLAAYGGPRAGRNKPPPKFKRAILQSPALSPVSDRGRMENVYQSFLKEVGVKDFDALQKADTKDLIRANSKTTYESPYGQFNYGPVIDEDYIKYPIHLQLKYGFMWPADIMVSYNRAEGMLFTPPWVRSRAELKDYILSAYPHFLDEEMNTLLDSVYPYDASLSAVEAVNATSQVLSDFVVKSNVYGLTQHYRYSAFEYKFNFFPGIHGQDANWTFRPTGDKNVNKEQRERFQRYLTSYIKWFVHEFEQGDPNTAKLSEDKDFEFYSDGQKHMQFGIAFLAPGVPVAPALSTFYGMLPDTLNDTTCNFWLNAPYWDPDKDSPENSVNLRTKYEDQMSQAHVEI
ncbi:hypothetical protein LTR64_006603 [Lithohypha guttulata]|uniref:uncharacterized protein n=1 Tax=Lithohypha guttulata TaxID=1690604 RepID=UPI002DE04804|nr:hypothetical protein LTR51_004839 [Lithohypha guttulata]